MMETQRRITLEIKGGVRCKALPKGIAAQIKTDLTFKNKLYDDAKKYGRFISQELSPTIDFWYEDIAAGQLYFPKGYMKSVVTLLKHHNLPYRIEDKTVCFKDDKRYNFKFTGSLRHYQQRACDDMLKYPNGLLEARTGSGKTVMGLYIIAQRQQPTLVLVHSKELLNQWKSAVKKFLGENAGTIGDGKYDVRPITIGIINSVRNKIAQVRDIFGHVICDECHRVPSSTFTDALLHMRGKYTLGLSATAFRNDGLDRAITAFVGPKLHTVSNIELEDVGAVLKPEIYKVKSDFYTPKTDFQDIIKSLSRDDIRNKLIAKIAIADTARQDEAILIAVDRVAMGETIGKLLESMGHKSHVLHGTISSDNRKRIVKDMREGRVKILIATTSLIGEGFDLDRLSSLLLASPIKYSGKLIQVVGRCIRPADGKTARVYDVRDDQVNTLYKQGVERDKIYKTQGWLLR